MILLGVAAVFAIRAGSYVASVQPDVRALSLFALAVGACGVMSVLFTGAPTLLRRVPAGITPALPLAQRLQIRTEYERARTVTFPSARLLRYVAIGDSSVEGLEDLDVYGRHRGWADRIADRLAAQHGEVLYANLAIRGRTTRQVLEGQLARAVAMRPDVAAVVAGTNDVLGWNFDPKVIEEDLYFMQRSLIDAGARVVTLTVPDLTRVMPVVRPLRKRIIALDEAIRRACLRSGASLCDLARFPVSSDPRVLSPDRLHANSEGHTRIAGGVAYSLGLPGSDMQWAEPFPEPLRSTFVSVLIAELKWVYGYLLPWFWRHARGRSSGDGITAKRPNLTSIVSEAVSVEPAEGWRATG